jgi:hypothetical protein
MAWAGLRLTGAIDDLPVGKYGFAQNVRSYAPDQITARPGLTSIGTVAGPVTGLERFDDPTPFATNPHLYIVGGGANVYTSVVGSGVFNNVDTGYSGTPLSFFSATPPQAAQPWLYVFDKNRARKFDANAHVFNVGIAPPVNEPTAVLQQIGTNVIDIFSGAFIPWTLVGAAAGPITNPARTNTTIFQLLYDNNHNTVFTAPSYASIIPASINGINAGMIVGLDASETVFITDVLLAVATTVIAAIIYDAGVTGFCTIQPLASLGTGQIEAPSQEAYAARFIPTPGDVPPEPDPLAAANARTRQVDFPVNCLVALNGGEIVRIESVALGADGIQSFRCFTTIQHFTGESIQGIPSCRAFLSVAHVAGETFQDAVLEHTLGPGTDIVGGIRTGAGWAARNLSVIFDRATLPDDDINLSCRVSLISEVQTIRLYLSMNPTGGSAPSDDDFLTNYYFFEWRQNDIAAAVQSQNAALVESLQDTRFLAVGNAQINQDLVVDVNGVTGATSGGLGPGTAAQAGSKMLQLGNLQWLELRCKVRDLQRIGTDPSLSLANVTAVELLVHMTGTNPISVDWDGLSVTGGFGPDSGVTAIPYVGMYRYRSSRTGGVSNFSPPLRGGVPSKRQRIVFNHTVSPDPQADLVDWFVLGGTLNRWTYAGTVPSGQPFNHDFSDSAITGGETPDYNNFPPWPTQDAPHSGVCSYAGNAVIWVSGDQFNTNWAPGSEIIINGNTYTLYSQPPTARLLFTNENIGNLNNQAFTVKGATLLNQIMAAAWGGPVAGAMFMFACGDPINPSQVHWTNPNDPESASDKNSLDVTSADEPLIGGFMDDGVSYVASTERIIRLEPTFGSASTFTPIETDCHRGFWNSYAFDRGIKGEYFLSKDGIYVTRGGSAAQSITDEDLYPLFPHDGQPGVAVNTIQPPDMTQSVLYLSCNDGWVYFDYKDVQGAAHTLAYRELDGAWHYDTYAQGISARNQASGQNVHQMLVGAINGKVYTSGGQTDDGVAFTATLQWVQDQKDARGQKLYRDLMLDGQNLNPVSVTLGFTNNSTTIGPISLAAAGAGRTQQQVDATLQTGNFGTNLTTLVTWSPQATPTILYVWDIAFQKSPELATSWLSGPTTHGQRGFQQVYQVLVPIISTSVVRFSLIVDGVANTYNIPSTGGIYAKIPVILKAVKGLTFQYGLDTAGAPFLLFDADFESWLSVWGTDGDYQIVRPF